jgi:secondary thiamine-phosphate synthase enzyme
MLKEIKLKTQKNDVCEITGQVKELVRESGAKDGLCIVYCPHTTASVVVTSRMDPAGFRDLIEETNRLVPTRIDFKHQLDTPTDASGHVKSAIYGISSVFIVSDGKLICGSSQGIFFFEFDGPRDRKVIVSILG